jgi:hypothetical protein
MGERPTESAQSMLNRAFLAFGVHPEVVRQHKNRSKGRLNNFNLHDKQTKRTGALVMPKMMGILADYLHEKETLRRTMYRMDTELSSPTLDRNPTAFLGDLEFHFSRFKRCFVIDGMKLTRVCRQLFKRTECPELGHMYARVEVETKDGVNSMFVILFALAEAGLKVTKGLAGALARKAPGVVEEYIDAGAEGLPE